MNFHEMGETTDKDYKKNASWKDFYFSSEYKYYICTTTDIFLCKIVAILNKVRLNKIPTILGGLVSCYKYISATFHK